MKYSTISIIAATFASVCSAAPAVAATTLPAKFGLFIVPVEGTAAQSLIPDIVTQPSSGFNLYLTKPNETEGKVPVIFTGKGTSINTVSPARGSAIFLAMKNQPSGSAVFLSDAFTNVEGGYTSDGLGSVGGGLVWDLKDGKGPQSRWGVCLIQNQWTLQWATASKPGRDCYNVDLRIREL